jgi:hypothetical protein
MAKLSITEYTSMAQHEGYGKPPELALEPGTDQEVTFTTATSSNAFAATTQYVRLVSDTNCRVKFGAAPTALATSQRMVADVEYWRAVEPTHKVSVYDGTS